MNTADYYQSFKNYFWIWEENAEVITIPDGSTIAFKDQINKLLNVLAEQGLPPFGSFLLTMIATNDTIDNSLELVYSKLENGIISTDKSNRETNVFFGESFNFLKELRNIPKEFRVGKRRQILIQTIFSNAHNRININTSKGLVSNGKGINFAIKKIQIQKELSLNIITKELRVLDLLARQFPTVESIIEAMGQLPEIENEFLPFLENSSVNENGDIIEELITNHSTFEIGILIKSIWAGLSIPIFNSQSSEMPLGGVSDLSNKGNFDKLLISEFANDDIVLMSRIANNQALYLHREMPPVTDKTQRIILIDVSLSSWGTPKALAYAVYLAIVKHPKAFTNSEAFAVGDTFESISHGSLGEIINGLQKVSIKLNAEQGLNEFILEKKDNKQLEVFFITSETSLKDFSLKNVLAEFKTSLKYIITTNQSGEINFFRNKINSIKQIQTIKLPIEKLWNDKEKRSLKTIKKVVEKEIKNQIPMLLNTPMDIKKTIPMGDYLYCIANKFLLKRRTNIKNDAGWELILSNLPLNSIYEIGQSESGEIYFLYFAMATKEVVITNISKQKSAKIDFNEWKGKHFKEFLFQNSKFNYISSNMKIHVFKPDFELGIITKEIVANDNSEIYGLYNDRQKFISDSQRTYSYTNTFKNLNSVYISNVNKLIINGHQLILKNDNCIRLESHGFSPIVSYNAICKVTKKSFEFSDGSTITVEKAGYIILNSSDSNIPNIYIPTSLEFNLGLSTVSNFAGNDFFFNKNYSNVSVKLIKISDQPIKTIQIIKAYSGLGLSDVKKIVDSCPSMISSEINFKDAERMIFELNEIGCQAEISNRSNSFQKIISLEKFYEENIGKFIQNIIQNGTKA
jgi:MoxR-vWA-beta-propeller ternary system domain bpX0/MoxR-vWA-beta-propeller ternary system domain bpX1/Ribosomal protein L7/L12 C-terminal domain